MPEDSVILPATGTTGTPHPPIRVRKTPAGNDMQAVNIVDGTDVLLGTATNAIRTDPTGATVQPVSATSLPLPTGAATAAKQDNEIAALGSTTDAKVQSDGNGSLIGFLRGVVSWLAELIGTVSQTPTQTKALRVQIGPGDVISSIPVVIDYEHHQVHEGEAYLWYTYASALNGTLNIRISVPTLDATTKTPHYTFEVIGDNNADIYLWEGTTWTSGGTDDSSRIQNRNRNIATAASTKIYLAGGTALTVNATGTEIDRWILISSARNSLSADRNQNEVDLKSNTEYNFQIVTSAPTKLLVRLRWYEDRGV